MVNEISDNNAGQGIQAFASSPGTSSFYDGVVVLYNAIGYDYNSCNCFELKPYTEQNEIFAHEVGHYLGLYHTFEGDDGGYTCPPSDPTKGDQVADTPAHIRAFSCPTGSNNCYDLTDPFSSYEKVIHNYMGYSPESCQHEFTQGQVDRMRAVLETSREGLLVSGAFNNSSAAQSLVSCQPQSAQGTNGEYGMGIILVKIGPLKAASGSTYQDGGYRDNTCRAANFEVSTKYDIEIKNHGSYNEDVSIYIDYNNDGIFENNELVFSSNI